MTVAELILILYLIGLFTAILAGERGRRMGLWFCLGFIFNWAAFFLVLFLPRQTAVNE